MLFRVKSATKKSRRSDNFILIYNGSIDRRLDGKNMKKIKKILNYYYRNVRPCIELINLHIYFVLEQKHLIKCFYKK